MGSSALTGRHDSIECFSDDTGAWPQGGGVLTDTAQEQPTKTSNTQKSMQRTEGETSQQTTKNQTKTHTLGNLALPTSDDLWPLRSLHFAEYLVIYSRLWLHN